MAMAHYHAVIWIDHSEAHVFHFTPEEVEKLTAHSTNTHPHSITSAAAPAQGMRRRTTPTSSTSPHC